MIVPFIPFDFTCRVVILASGLDKSSGTIYVFLRRASDGYWWSLASSGSWVASKPTGGNVPTATYVSTGVWKLNFTSAQTGALVPGDQLTWVMTDHETEASATVTSTQGDAFVDLTAIQVRDTVESQRGRHTMTGRMVYVGPTTGNDTTGNGTRALPYATVTKALSVITTGTHATVFVLADAASTVTTLTEAIAWNKRYTFLRGPGRDLIIKGATTNTPTITVTVDGAEFSGFQLESHATGSSAHGISASAADFMRVHNVYVNATQGTGITMSNCSNARIHDNTFQGTGVSATGHGLVIACSVTSNAQSNVVENNRFRDVQGDAIRLTKSGSGVNDNNVLCGNCIDDSTGYGINIGASVTHTLVTPNNVFGSNASGDVLDSGTGTHRGAVYGESQTLTGALAVGSLTINGTGAAAAIADQVWDEVLSGHLTAGSTGAALNSVSSTQTGTGSVTATVLDTLAAAVPGVTVTLLANGAVVSHGTSDSNGQVVLAHSGGAVVVQGFVAGYAVASDDLGTLGASDVTTASLTATAQQGTPAANPAVCTLYTTLYHLDGSAAVGVVGTCRLTSLPYTVSADYVEGQVQQATSDSNGLIQWTAPRGAEVRIEVHGYISKTVDVPSAASAEVSAL